jgi:outer membrane protein OmpA-like peptidoglycan-associated protein
MKYVRVLVVAGMIAGVSACATDDPARRAKTGAAIGAVVGALAGGAVGNYMDKQHAQLERELAAEAARNELNITRLSGDALKIGIASDVSFDLNSAQIRSDALNTYAKIANVLQSYDKTVIHVVGHTDSTGTDAHNQGLSERRAASVASYLAGQGVPVSRLRQEGRGERELLVRTGDNVNESRNRRVDIVIKPIIEGQEQQAWTPPPYLGS